MGGSVGDAFAGSMIELFDNACKHFVGYLSEVQALREIPSQQGVRVFIRPALPGGMGIGEIDRRAGMPLNSL
jgi:hypothetical protein